MENTVTITLSRFKQLEEKEATLKKLEGMNPFVKISVGQSSWGLSLEKNMRYFNIETESKEMKEYLAEMTERISEEVKINNAKEIDARNYRRIPNWVKKIFVK